MVICLNIYFPGLIRVIALCKVKESGLGSRCSSISAGTDGLTSSECIPAPEIACTSLICPKIMAYANYLGSSGLWVLKEVINNDYEPTGGYCSVKVLYSKPVEGGWSYSAAFLLSLL